MKILKSLSAELDPANPEWKETRGIVGTVLDQPVRGFVRHIQLGQAGLTVSLPKFGPDKKPISVNLPLTELLKLAEAHEPALCPPPVAPKLAAKAEPANTIAPGAPVSKPA